MKGATAAAIIAPSFGPAVVTLFGQEVPVLATSLSVLALLLARWIAPPPLRQLAPFEQVALTLLLIILLFVAVTGNLPGIGEGKPMGVGMAVVWGVGLGLSGLMVVEIMGDHVRAKLRALFGGQDDRP